MINNVDASAYIQPLSSEVIVQNTREKFLYCNMYGDLLKKKVKKCAHEALNLCDSLRPWDKVLVTFRDGYSHSVCCASIWCLCKQHRLERSQFTKKARQRPKTGGLNEAERRFTSASPQQASGFNHGAVSMASGWCKKGLFSIKMLCGCNCSSRACSFLLKFVRLHCVLIHPGDFVHCDSCWYAILARFCRRRRRQHGSMLLFGLLPLFLLLRFLFSV